MRISLLIAFTFASMTAQASVKCTATLFKQGLAVKSDLVVQKVEGDITILGTEIQERVFQVAHAGNNKTYVLKIEDSKTNQRTETTLLNVSPDQESSGIALAGSPLKLDEESTERTLLVCTK